jgi:hypothetical protein
MNLKGATRRKDEKYHGKEIKNQGQKELGGKVKGKVGKAKEKEEMEKVKREED